MVVYVEYVAINNFIIDCLLILSARKAMNLPLNKAFVCLSAAVGAAFAVVTPLLKMNAAFTFVLKFFAGALIVLVSGKFPNFRIYVRCFYLFLFFTFAFGGAVFGAFYFAGISYDVFSRTTPAESVLTIILLIVFVMYFVACALIKKLYKRKEIANFIRKCEFTVGGRIYIVNGFLDSGNRLRYKNDPIIIVSPKFAAKLMKNEVFSLVRPRYSTISTIAGEKVIKIYKISRIKIYNGTSVNIINNVMLGIAEREFMSGGEYDLILGTVFA